MAQNVSEGEIKAVDHGICVPLPLELQACLQGDIFVSPQLSQTDRKNTADFTYITYMNANMNWL